jgi:uncharacterized cupredoxin-like copper-binding protein
MRRRSAVILLALGGSTLLTACGDTEPDPRAGASTTTVGQGADASELEVVAEDIHFSATELSSRPGPVHLTYRNAGSIEHSLKIEGVDGFRLVVPTNGAEDEATVDLDAGTYTLYCDIPGHRAAGMEATLTVR